jgi:SAM-dependent methyltransferase
MDVLDILQIILVIFIAFFVANYLYGRWSLQKRRMTELDDCDMEGFQNQGDPDAAAGTVIIGNELLYDDFYAKIYDKIVDGEQREDAEVALTLGWAKKYRPDTKSILVVDVGCGTGAQVDLFRKAGVGKAVGIDRSSAMIGRGKAMHPKADLREGDAEIIGQFAAGEFTLATLYYFTYYYLQHKTVALKNIFSWLQPGGCLVIHLVNREKFDPILESASPFVAFSVQKYSKERITRSSVTFDKFVYTANFELEGAKAEFVETFDFHDGKKRKQIHTLHMPTMAEIVSEVESCGFKYKEYIDLTGIGYEYQYLFCFVR